MNPRNTDFRMGLSSARHDAHQLADSLTLAWSVALHAPAKPEELALLLKEASAALERINVLAETLGISAGLRRLQEADFPSVLGPVICGPVTINPAGFIDSATGKIAMFHNAKPSGSFSDPEGGAA